MDKLQQTVVMDKFSSSACEPRGGSLEEASLTRELEVKCGQLSILSKKNDNRIG